MRVWVLDIIRSPDDVSVLRRSPDFLAPAIAEVCFPNGDDTKVFRLGTYATASS
ncbi:hypothetical protein NG791_01900 [Laspinema sp. D1]|nr:hypothetical protein [Laspinema sp. D2b]